MLLSYKVRESQDYEENFEIRYIKDEEALRLFMKTNQNFKLQNRERRPLKTSYITGLPACIVF